MDISLHLIPGGRIDAGVELGRYPTPGIEIATESIAGGDCITINCHAAQVEDIVRALLVDFIAKGEVVRSRSILEEAAEELRQAEAVIAAREAERPCSQ